MRQEGSPDRGALPDKHARGMLIVQSVERAARILDALYREPRGKRVADLSRSLALPKRTVRRLLVTLVALGVVEKAENGEAYHRNPALWLAMACDLPGLESNSDTVQRVLSHLEEETGLSADLAAPEHQRRAMVMIDWYVLRSALGLKARHRVSVPMHATAVGTVYLASLSRSEMHEIAPARLTKFTEHTISSRARLISELREVRKRGYAVCRGTFIADSGAAAVPVLDARGRAIACISLGGPAELLTEATIQRCLPALRRASERLSRLAHAAPPLGFGGRAAGPEQPPPAEPADAAGLANPGESAFRPQERAQAMAVGAGLVGLAAEPGRRLPIVRAVERAVRIVQALWHSAEPRRLSDLSAEVGVHKATVLRLLRTLVATGVVYRDQRSDAYVCSPFCWLGVSCAAEGIAVPARTVRMILEEMADAAKMVVWLATPDPVRRKTTVAATAMPQSWMRPEDRGKRVDPLEAMVSGKLSMVVNSPSELEELMERAALVAARIRFDAVERRGEPVHTSASGKVYLASLADAELLEWLPAELPKVTEHTITSRERLLAELARVREQGYAVSRGEAVLGVFSLGVPIRGAGGRSIASLGVAAPMERMSDARMSRCLRILRMGSEQIAEILRATRMNARESVRREA